MASNLFSDPNPSGTQKSTIATTGINPSLLESNSFSGVDIQIVATVPQDIVDYAKTIMSSPSVQNQADAKAVGEKLDKLRRPVVLGTATTFSYSIHRENFPVRSLGKNYVTNYTRGPRTIAGSIVFTIFNESVAMLFAAFDPFTEANHDNMSPFLLLDQLPPLDLTLVFANEYGFVSRMAVYGVRFMNEGQVMSVSDLIVENTVQYVAKYIEPMQDISNLNIRTPTDAAAEPITRINSVNFFDPMKAIAQDPDLLSIANQFNAFR